MTWKRIIFLMAVVDIRATATEYCPQSRQTVSVVASCPRNKDEWQRRSDLKQCSSQLCNGKSVYHCAINSFANETIEVCAPEGRIIGHSCVEYNWRGAVIQDSRSMKCKDSCPFSYNSTEAYKYQECFQKLERDKESRYVQEIDNSTERNWKITAIFFIIATLISTLYILWITFLKKKLKKKKKSTGRYAYQTQGDEGESFVSETEDKKKDSKEKERKSQIIPGKRGLCVAGVDIGDSFLTMALSRPESPEDIILLGTFERISLLLDENNKSIAFGDEAFSKFTENKSKDERYEDGFKLSNEEIDPDIYGEAIKQILLRLYSALDKELEKNLQATIHYAFVVPTYWSEEARNKLERHILDNKGDTLKNIDKEHLRVIQREQTLSPFIHEVNARVLCLNFNVDNLILNLAIRNYSYAILHVGSTYCDLTFLKVKKKRDTKNLPYVKRHEWKILPRQYLLNLLASVYGNSAVDLWRKNHRRDFIKLVYEFEKLQKNWTKNTDETTAFALDLPESLPAKEDTENAEKNVSKTNKLNITHKYLNNFFKEMKDQVTEWIISEKKSFKDVSCVVMTGTYSNIEMVWNKAERKWFKDMSVTVAVPKNVHVFAMGGAYYVQKEMAMKATEPTGEPVLG